MRNLLKDLNLAAEASAGTGWTPPLNTFARQIFDQAVRSGYGDEDYSAVVKVLADEAGATLES